jgi:hypothetical protein
MIKVELLNPTDGKLYASAKNITLVEKYRAGRPRHGGSVQFPRRFEPADAVVFVAISTLSAVKNATLPHHDCWNVGSGADPPDGL